MEPQIAGPSNFTEPRHGIDVKLRMSSNITRTVARAVYSNFTLPGRTEGNNNNTLHIYNPANWMLPNGDPLTEGRNVFLLGEMRTINGRNESFSSR
jgi:hypothetical protein